MVQKKNKKDPRHNLSASKIKTHNFTDKQPICFSFNQVTQNYVHISAHVQSINWRTKYFLTTEMLTNQQKPDYG